MNCRRFIAASVLTAGLISPSVAQAQAPPPPSDEVLHDARTEGYNPKGQVEKATVALMWMLFLFLSVICLAVMFKDARRTHLD
ncbi:MAG TPA: hypothetical protein VN541_23850 [Tepidisphaeraceae bacterium]|nr:hypothetical protein [Tepidisphaeraceae bacterium]